jgi:hypothetical protein
MSGLAQLIDGFDVSRRSNGRSLDFLANCSRATPIGFNSFHRVSLRFAPSMYGAILAKQAGITSVPACFLSL